MAQENKNLMSKIVPTLIGILIVQSIGLGIGAIRVVGQVGTNTEHLSKAESEIENLESTVNKVDRTLVKVQTNINNMEDDISQIREDNKAMRKIMLQILLEVKK